MFTIEFGLTYQDKITGFKGVATGECGYISGCNQVLLAPKVEKDGTFKKSTWFDVQRVEKIKSKKIVLGNKDPGFDVEAPTK